MIIRALIFSLLMLIATAKAYSFSFPPYHPLLNNTYVKDSNALYFNFYNANFLWNNEFFNDIVNGYTLIGYFITPEFQYHLTPNIKIQAGVHLLKYTGTDDFTTITPTYSVIYTKHDFTLIMGKIKGTINHRLLEPMLFSERYFTNNLENGVQYLLNKEKLHMDLWLDWKSFIFPMDNKQEELVAGLSLIPSPIKNENWEVSVPFSLLAGHRGGQIDASTANMKTVMNYSAGLHFQKNLPFRFLDKIIFETHALGFRDNSPTVESLFEKGNGFMNQLSMGYNDNFFNVAYWNSSQFLSLLGHPIYQSYSEKGDEFNQRNREILSFHLFYSKSIHKSIYLGLMGDTYIDLINGDTDYSMGLSLIIKNLFFIKRFKQPESLQK
jgi:hypothetical protein